MKKLVTIFSIVLSISIIVLSSCTSENQEDGKESFSYDKWDMRIHSIDSTGNIKYNITKEWVNDSIYVLEEATVENSNIVLMFRFKDRETKKYHFSVTTKTENDEELSIYVSEKDGNIYDETHYYAYRAPEHKKLVKAMKELFKENKDDIDGLIRIAL